MAHEPATAVYGYPLSFAQRRLWFLDQLFPGTALHNLPLVVRVSVPVDAALLERCLLETAARHETLRTTFRTVDGEPVQVVASSCDVRLRVVGLEHLPDAERDTAARAIVEGDVRRPFDLAAGPLWRATLLRLAPAEHTLLLTSHHLVSDGWSMGLMLREMQQLYMALAHDRPSPLPPLPLQYVEYAIWQHEMLAAGQFDADLDYWRATLADLPTLQLPTDRPHPGAASLRGRREYLHVAARLRRAVDDVARQESATPFMVLLAAFAVLLHRSTGETDLPVGTPIAGRGRAELETMIGLFGNTLVLRVDLSGQPSFRALVGRVRERALGAYAYQDLPFQMLVERLQPSRDAGRNPLFQVMFTLQNAATAAPTGTDVAHDSLEVDTELTSLDLALDVWPTQDAYAARFEYNTDLFDAATVRRLAEEWLHVLDEVTRDPDRAVAAASWLRDDERRRVVDTWAHGIAPDAADPLRMARCALHVPIAERAAQAPHAPAVTSDGESLTFGELDRRAERLARVLCARGVGPEGPVVVLLERTPALVVALLAVWKAGGAYVPLDPREPAARRALVLDDVSPAAVLTSRAHAAELGPHVAATRIIFVDAPLPEPDWEPHAPITSPSHLAYVLYTSGTTGRPKGVMVEHGALGNHLRWMHRWFPLGPGDRVLQTTSVGFDVSLWELVAPLAAGAELVLAPDGTERDPLDLVSLIARHGVCALQTTPAQLGVLLDSPQLAACTALRWVFCGAERMPRALAERFARAPLRATLYNMYGPTEAAIDVAYYACPRDTPLPDTRSGTVPIGRPIDGACLYVLDDALAPVSPGTPGELHVGGAGVARGYWGEPELTAARFIADPFGPPGARLYRTGDRARHLPSGDLELLSRLDRQIKLRGVRIEPEEIEHALAAHPGVREVAVSLQSASAPERDDARLVAVVAGEAPGLSTAALREFACQRLPSAMRPASLVVVDALPRTARGKIDRDALARLASAAAPHGAAERAHQPPRDDVEREIADIWQALLRVDRVGVDDNFFELGGHSLLATRVVSRIIERLGVAVPLRALFAHPTVAGLAGHIAGTRAEGTAGDAATRAGSIYDGIRRVARPLAPDAVSDLSDVEVEQLLRAMIAREARA